MKKSIVFVLVVFVLLGGVFAEEKIHSTPLKWYCPEILAQGGSATANVKGYNSLFTNPAGFATDKGEFNIFTAQPSAAQDIFQYMDDRVDKSFLESILNQITTNGVGANMQVSIGYVGHGIGIGGFSSLESSFPQVDTPLGAKGDVWWTSGIIAGYSLGFNFFGIDWKVGADVRPMYRIMMKDVDVCTLVDVIERAEDDSIELDVLSGFGLGFDVGLQGTWHDLTLGLSLRDVGRTNFNYVEKTINRKFQTIKGTKKDCVDKYVAPMTMNVGLAYNPQFSFSHIVDSTIHADLAIPLSSESKIDEFTVGSIWTRLNMGAEIEFADLVALRLGCSGGYFSCGLGVEFLVFDINLAIFSQETGVYAGDQRTMGAAFELSFKI